MELKDKFAGDYFDGWEQKMDEVLMSDDEDDRDKHEDHDASSAQSNAGEKKPDAYSVSSAESKNKQEPSVNLENQPAKPDIPPPTPITPFPGNEATRVTPFPTKDQSVALADDNDAEAVGELEIQIDDQPPVKREFVFTLPELPGSDVAEKVVVPQVQEEKDADPWKWEVGSFMPWLADKLHAIPKHTGKEITGVERAISFLKRLLSEISKAVQADIDGALDIAEVENVRDEIISGLDRLEERQEQLSQTKGKKGKKKKADSDGEGIVKEARAGKFTVVVPLFISALGRILVNSTVSAGKDMEDTFEKLSKKYDLTEREELELMQLLSDMGFPMHRPRGYNRDEKIDPTSTENFDWLANYPG